MIAAVVAVFLFIHFDAAWWWYAIAFVAGALDDNQRRKELSAAVGSIQLGLRRIYQRFGIEE